MLTLILVAGLRATGELDPSNATTWLIACWLVALLVAIAALYLRMRARPSPSAT